MTGILYILQIHTTLYLLIHFCVLSYQNINVHTTDRIAFQTQISLTLFQLISEQNSEIQYENCFDDVSRNSSNLRLYIPDTFTQHVGVNK